MAGNQYKPDPRQSLFLSYYLDPKSKTFSNAYQSALKAGYEDEYAKVITSDSKGLEWLSEAVNDSYILKTAENNLREFLEMDITITRDGIKFTDSQLAKIKQDTTKFALEKLNKKKYSSKTDSDITVTVLKGLVDVK
jgi:phage terminase small subunit